MTYLKAPFTPDWISPPGDTIDDILRERGWTQAELARRLGYTEEHVSQLINGEAPITEDTAARLERVLGSTPGFWLRKEAIYRKQLRRLQLVQQLTEIERDRLATKLQAEVEVLRAEVNGTIRELLSERAQLAVENARLREALKDIRSLSFINLAMQPNSLTLTTMLGDIHQIADAALAQENHNV